MPPNLHVKFSKLLSTWQPPSLFSRMFSMVAYGRLVARVITNSISQGQYQYAPYTASVGKRSIQHYSSPAREINPCRLVSAISGFSKFDSPARRTSRVPPAAVSVIDKTSYGDDAFFVTCHSTTDVLGVADGVGGWRQYGIDPSQFSKKLMQTCEMLVKTGRFVPNRPSELLASGYKELLEDKAALAGSSTACIVALDRTNQTLHTANLGDSGFMVVRRGSVVHRSTEQQHSFNTPYQLSLPPEEHGTEVLRDNAEDADTSTFNLELGDIILTATDGLFDNLPDSVILEKLTQLKAVVDRREAYSIWYIGKRRSKRLIVINGPTSHDVLTFISLRVLQDSKYESIKKTAWSIAECALTKSFDPNYMSPFAKQARRNGYTITGGKPDDITILLSMVTDSGG